MIRILHTADWHLGREFHGRDLTSLHEYFFDWLLAEVADREIDLVLMAGDIFDRALPPVGAVQMFNQQLARLSDLAEVVLITGNHDSVVRMSHGPLMKPSIHLRSGVEQLAEPVLIESDLPLAVYPIPYLDPSTVSSRLDLDENSHEAVLGEATRRSLEDLAGRPGTRGIAIGHAFITGAEPSESERDIRVGGSDQVPAGLFDGFDYVALGHLHRPQSVAGDRVRYSGSPIPLSFSEVDAGAPKSVTMIELAADGTIELEAIPIPQLVKMARIKGEIDDLINDPALSDLEDAWLEVTLTDPIRPDRPVERLRTRFKGLIHPRFDAPILTGGDTLDAARIRKLDPVDVVTEFIRHVRGEESGPDPEERELITRAFDERTGAETRA